MDEVTLYMIKSWVLFLAILFPVGMGLVLLIDWIFQKIDDRKKWEDKNEAK